MFQHTVLGAMPSPDHAEARGLIARASALDLIRTYPFEAEVRKHLREPDLTVPTITFTDAILGHEFTVWSADPNRYIVWVPHLFALAEGVVGRPEVLEVLAHFLDGDWEELEERMGELRAKYSGDGAG